MHLAVAALVLFGSFLTINSERHSLEYVYTALSKPIHQHERHSLEYVYTALSKPIHQHGIHEFTAMGLLNDRMIDYYDNDLQKKVPKQDWMKERLDKDYWDKGTQSRKFKEQWFKVNIGILMDRMRQNDSDVHSLQWRHGCEVEEKQGSVKFIQGFDQYSYDGDDFLAFDDTSTQWVAPNAAALPTKRKWDGEQILNQYTKGYLEKECVDWLNKFMDYGQKSLREGKPPVVETYGKASKTVGNVKLTCWATGFLPKEITLHIRKNKVVISDGVETSGVRPNHDDTHQIWQRVEIPMNDQGNYDCFVNHKALSEPIIKAFPENKCGDCPLVKVGTIGGVVGFIVCLAFVGGLLFILYKRGIIRHSSGGTPSLTCSTQSIGASADFNSSGGTPSPPGSSVVIVVSAETADESTTLLLNKESTQHMNDKKGGSDSNSDSGHSSGENSSLTGSTKSVDASAGTANESAAPLRNKDSTQHMDDGSNSSDSGAGSHESLSQSSREEVV
ncbi:H-2 class I histocompatibility antigen, Q10 alpha chain-like isoform X5 [Osmerus eperlanus]|uniref:H-2 class I histocompatibility antigen, Q10 alpha chain-like isoform X5 n=1 Tax=Osmerus eperlanus TaxID=29151 RepID=UPI002E149CC0